MPSLLAATSARRPRGRMALSVLGIALGVALGYAVHLVNRAAVSDLAAAVRSLAGEADLEVRGGRAGFSELLYPRIARIPGVAVASPVLELDVGVAGSGRTLRVVGLDILHNKLRYMRRYGVPLVRGSTFALPVRDQSFDCVVSSQVIEHIPYDESIFSEFRRVLRPGGLLVLGAIVLAQTAREL